MAESFAGRIEAYDLTIPGWRLLAALYNQNGQRIGELATTISLEVWSVSRLAMVLEEGGLVRRQRESRDSRAVGVFLTEQGRVLVETIIPMARDYEAIPLRGFSDREKQQLRDLLERVYTNLTDLEDAAASSSAVKVDGKTSKAPRSATSS
jgi:DNA-binding MarR family transcriptional regulator